MADLKISELGSALLPLQDNDLFIVRLKSRPTTIGDEDRKLTWAELKGAQGLNLAQYMPLSGGNITNEITLNNNKALKAKPTSGTAVALIYLDSSNRTVVGSATQPLRLTSSVVPQWVTSSAAYDIITSNNLPNPGDLGDKAKGSAYTQTQVDGLLAKKLNLTGGTLSGDITFNNNKGIKGKTTAGAAVNIGYVDALGTVVLGDKTLTSIIASNILPQWYDGTTKVDFITTANLPTPAQLSGGGAYTKTEADGLLNKKLNLTGGTITGKICINNHQQFTTITGAQAVTPNVEATVFYAGTNSLAIGDVKQGTDIRGAGDLTFNSHVVYTTAHLPTTTELGIEDRLKKADKAVQPGNYGLGGTPSHRNDASFLATTDTTEFFVQDGSATEQRFGGTTGNGGTNGLGAGIHVYYGKTGTGTSTQYKSASFFIREDGMVVSKWSHLNNTGALIDTKSAVHYTTLNKPTAADVGTYTATQMNATYAKKGVNSDITALNGLTGALKVGADAQQPLELTTLRQVQQLTGGTASAVVGVVGGFIGAVMWFQGSRASIPAGWAAADGQLLGRNAYPDLWAAINSSALKRVTDQQWLAGPGGGIPVGQFRGMYSLGDGTSTFRMPDLNGVLAESIPALFLRGDAGGRIGTEIGAVGEVLPAAAPNINGSISIAANLGYIGAYHLPNGSFTGVQEGNGQNTLPSSALTGQALGDRFPRVDFDASNSSQVYGRKNANGTTPATELRPNSVAGIWIIRVSNNFEAANTSFTVYNGTDTEPSATATQIHGGVLASRYNVKNATRAVTMLYANKEKWSNSYVTANIDVANYAANGSIINNSTFQFSSEGGFYSAGGVTAGAGQAVRADRDATASFRGSNGGSLQSRIITAGSERAAFGLYVNVENSTNETRTGHLSLIADGKTSKDWVFDLNGKLTCPGIVQALTFTGTQSKLMSWTEQGQRAGTVHAGDYSVGENVFTSGFSLRTSCVGGYMTTAHLGQIHNNAGSFAEVFLSTVGDANALYATRLSIQPNREDVFLYFAAPSGASNAYSLQRNAVSDATMKHDIRDYDGQQSLDNINKFELKTFVFNNDAQKRVRRGIIAQQIEQVDKQYVKTRVYSPEPGVEKVQKELDTNVLLLDALAAIKVLSQKIEKLEAQLSAK